MSLNSLEKKIADTYTEAAAEMKGTVDEYFNSFKARDNEQLQLLKQGKITDQQYKQWRLNQIGRGERFQDMREALAERYVRADEVAVYYVNNEMAAVYALERNHTIRGVQADGYVQNANFIQYDEYTVKRLLTEDPDLMPNYPESRAIRRGIDLAYGKRQITASVTSSILQGKSISRMADDLQKRIQTMSRESAIRTARTAFTAAENAGRQDAAEELEKMGCIMKKQWISTFDDRTREEHLEADGQMVDIDEPFIVGGEELMYPGDDSMGASGWNIYNCRCSTKDVCVGFHSILSEDLQAQFKVTS